MPTPERDVEMAKAIDEAEEADKAPVDSPDAEHYLQHPSDTSYTEHPDYP